MNTLDLEVLSNFLTVVSCGSISAAARKLMVAQPAISRQMQKLEAEMGCKLFERGRRIVLTDADKALKADAENLQLMAQKLRENMQNFSCRKDLPLRIALTPHNTSVFLDKVISPFLQKYPDMRFEMYEKNTQEILPLIKQGEVELAIVNSVYTDEYKVHYCIRDPLVAAWHPELKVYPFSKESLCINDLNSLPLSIIRAMQEDLNGHCISQGFVPNIISISSQLSTALVMAKSKKAVAIVPYSSVKDSGLSYAFFSEDFMAFPTNVLSRFTPLGSAAASFLEFFRQETAVFPFD